MIFLSQAKLKAKSKEYAALTTLKSPPLPLQIAAGASINICKANAPEPVNEEFACGTAEFVQLMRLLDVLSNSFCGRCSYVPTFSHRNYLLVMFHNCLHLRCCTSPLQYAQPKGVLPASWHFPTLHTPWQTAPGQNLPNLGERGDMLGVLRSACRTTPPQFQRRKVLQAFGNSCTILSELENRLA